MKRALAGAVLLGVAVLSLFGFGPKKLPVEIPTRTLVEKDYHIKPEQLPAPFASNSARKPPKVISLPEDIYLNVPDGFKVNVYASHLEKPRWLSLTPEGDVLVVESHSHRIKRLVDKNNDGVSDRVELFADISNGLYLPFGMSFSRTHFYVGNTGDVRRYVYDKEKRSISGQGDVIVRLPHDGYNNHWTRNVILSPDDSLLYVTVGSASNADVEPIPRATILRMRPDGSESVVFASGLRNPIGLAFHPQTQALYASVNERDELGDELVPDYITKVKGRGFYGWPYAYFKPELLDPRHVKKGKSVAPDLVAKIIQPDVLLQAHSAVMDIEFAYSTNFPEKYRNGLFASLRGSWNRDRGTGYKIIYVPFGKDRQPEGGYEDFLTGFLVDPTGPTTWGRPVGMAVLPDGSLLFCDEPNGRIYRISYSGL